MIRSPIAFYQELFGKRWPASWDVQSVMGLTDLEGETIYIADGLSPTDAFETLIHEFVHMNGHDRHTEDFDQACSKLLAKAIKLGIRWEGLQD